MTRAIPVALSFLLLAGCEQPPEQTPLRTFAQEVDLTIAELQRNYSSLEPRTGERINTSRGLVSPLMATVRNDSQAALLADRFAKALRTSETFQMFDYDILWIGSDVLVKFPPQDKSFLMAVARKVQHARRPDAPHAYRTLYSGIAVGLLVNLVDYPGRVETYDDRLNEAQWQRFFAWLEEHFDVLEYSPEKTKYRRTDQVVTPRRRALPE